MAKLFVLLIFDIAYEAAGYMIAAAMSAISGIRLEEAGQQMILTLATGVLLWAASMPCILIVVWCNKSYIISVIIAFAYVTLNYILRINDSFLMVPAGLNLPTFLPVPMIFRWLYQFHSIENVGEVLAEFYERFQPYFISGPLVFTVLLSEAAVCIALIIQVYKKQDV